MSWEWRPNRPLNLGELAERGQTGVLIEAIVMRRVDDGTVEIELVSHRTAEGWITHGSFDVMSDILPVQVES